MNKEDKNFSQILSELMAGKSLNASKLAELTGVPVRFIDLFLNGNFDRLPPAPYLRGYLLKFADVLEVDSDELWQLFQKGNSELKKSGPFDRLPQNRFELQKINQHVVLVSALFLLLLVYLGFRANDFLGQPSLYLASPAIDAVVNEPIIEIRGQIEARDLLKINGEETYADENGNFRKSFNLQPGLNTLEFKVKRFLGREISVIRHVIYHQE